MATPPTRAEAARRSLSRRGGLGTFERYWERGVEMTLLAAASLAILVTGGILFVLITNSMTFFREVSVVEFVTGTRWEPDAAINAAYGVLPLVNGTLVVTIGAAILAVPLGLGTAIYLSEFAHARVRALLKPAVELLAGIPSIAFGLFAILVISPILQRTLNAEVFNALNAIIVLSFMILPIITTLSEDALRSVPQELRAGALALGATKWEVTKQVVVPAALSGITASILLGFSRAIGETMAVTLAAGLKPQLGLNLLESIQTMTSFIALRAQGDIVHEGPSYYSLFAVGLLLFVITFTVNLVAAAILRRYREVY